MPSRRHRSFSLACAGLASAALGLASLGAASAASEPAGPRHAPARPAAHQAGLAVTVSVERTGLDIPWDIAFVNATQYLLTERSGRLWLGSTDTNVALKRVNAPLGDLWLNLEAGLLGLAIDPGFDTNRQFYTCQSHRGPVGSPNDMRVVKWRLSADGSRASKVGAPIVQGIMVNRIHVGCRLVIGPDRKLWITTGDAANGAAPQTKANLSGKILRVNLNGSIPADNPWASQAGKIRYVWNFGHRNPQGLVQRPGSTMMFSAEHGPDRDDEVNIVRRAGNYGWDPRYPGGSAGYNQSVPMTDLTKFPNAVQAIWSSGSPTIATSGLAFLAGSQWGTWDGALAVAQLKGAGVMMLSLDAAGAVTAREEIPELDDTYGRIRTLRLAPDGSLYVLTSNGGSSDRVLRVVPAG